MRIAVTGALGVVGKVVVQHCLDEGRLDEGHEVIQIDLPGVRYDSSNVTVREIDVAHDYHGLLDAIRDCEAVIHLAALPNPIGREDYVTHNTNVQANFNMLRAAAELGIRKICQASSCNAIGLSFANQPLHFDYFPIDEAAPARPTDSYALSKITAELQADCIARWFPGTTIVSLRFHAVKPLKQVMQDWADQPDEEAQHLWSWTHPQAAARACLLAVTGEKFIGHEVFNIVAPTSSRPDTPSPELARRFYPKTELRNLGDKDSFWTSTKAEQMLGWRHVETD